METIFTTGASTGSSEEAQPQRLKEVKTQTSEATEITTFKLNGYICQQFIQAKMDFKYLTDFMIIHPAHGRKAT